MLISLKHRFVFVANSKAASTSVEHALARHADFIVGGMPARKHMPLHEAIRRYDVIFGQPGHAPDSFFRFGVMRDPVEWIGSWFRYRSSGGGGTNSPLPAGMSFAAFWEMGDWNRFLPGGTPRLQRRCFTDPAGRPIVDYVIRHESLDEEFAAVCAHLGITADLGRRNRSRGSAAPVVPDALVDEVRAFYRDDYEFLGQLPALNARGLARRAA